MSDFDSTSELKAAALKASALEEAKRAAERKTGLKGNTALAKVLDGAVSSQAISQWDQVPVLRVLDVERLTGVPRHELRPDIYPAPDPASSEPERAAS